MAERELVGLTAGTSRPTPSEFDKFLREIELTNLRLIAINAESSMAALSPETPATVNTEASADSEIRDSEFEIRQTLKVALIGPNDEVMGNVNVTIGLTYSLGAARTKPNIESLIKIFIETSVLLHAWPYLREMVTAVTIRFGWPPLILPLFKPAVTAATTKKSRSASTRSKSTKRRRHDA